MKRVIKIVVLMLMAWVGQNGSAQEAKVRERIALLGIGHASGLDTYLSPEHFGGLELRGICQSYSHHNSWAHIWRAEGMVASMQPRIENSSELSGMATLMYALQSDIYSNEVFSIAAGPMAEAFLGGIYNDRNGNNPAQMKAGLHIGPSVRANYDMHLWKKLFGLSYQVHAPLFGLQFSPAFGQSYYELFGRGNYDHNICFAWPVNAPSLEHSLTVDIPFKRHTLVVGYLGDFRQSKLNSLKYHNYTHSLLIGIRL